MIAEASTKMPVIAELIRDEGAIAPETPVMKISERFQNDPTLEALAIVADNRPCGLATRRSILNMMVERFGYELYGRKPIVSIADMQPLIVSVSTPLDEVLNRAMARNFTDIYDEILVVDGVDGHYLGKLSVKELIIKQGKHLALSMSQQELAMARADEMEKLNQVKTSFMAHITHELRSPVNAIVGFSELMQEQFVQQKTADFPQYLTLLGKNASNLRSLINNILDLAKIEAGRMELHAETFSLEELLAEITETGRVLIGAKPLVLELDAVDAAWQLQADRGKIRQILLNLTSNAVKYTDRGLIVISASINGEALECSVKDTGIGIRKENLSRLFDAFDQLEDAKSRRHEGTGLGLAITRQLVQLLGGEVDVESTYGVGSRFNLRIPVTVHQKIQEAS